MAYTRTCVPASESIVLRAVFTDTCGDPHDIDDLNNLEIAIYKPANSDLVTGTWKEEIDKETLRGTEGAKFRAIAARANYLALDRPDIHYAVK